MKLLNTIKKAGLTVQEFADLCGVSRVSIYKWDRGDGVHPLRVSRVDKLVLAIKSATATREFPPKSHSARSNKAAATARDKEIKGTVLRYLKKM